MTRRILLCCIIMASLTSAAFSQGAPFYQAASTKQMADLLASIYKNSDWKADPNKPAERIVYYRSLLKKGLRPADEVLVAEQLAEEQLRAGDSAGAVDTLEAIKRRAELKDVLASGPLKHTLHEKLALSYLRLGEQENCASMHGQQSCIFPIHSSGHTSCQGELKARRANLPCCSMRMRRTTSLDGY